MSRRRRTVARRSLSCSRITKIWDSSSRKRWPRARPPFRWKSKRSSNFRRLSENVKTRSRLWALRLKRKSSRLLNKSSCWPRPKTNLEIFSRRWVSVSRRRGIVAKRSLSCSRITKIYMSRDSNSRLPSRSRRMAMSCLTLSWELSSRDLNRKWQKTSKLLLTRNSLCRARTRKFINSLKLSSHKTNRYQSSMPRSKRKRWSRASQSN